MTDMMAATAQKPFNKHECLASRKAHLDSWSGRKDDGLDHIQCEVMNHERSFVVGSSPFPMQIACQKRGEVFTWYRLTFELFP